MRATFLSFLLLILHVHGAIKINSLDNGTTVYLSDYGQLIAVYADGINTTLGLNSGITLSWLEKVAVQFTPAQVKQLPGGGVEFSRMVAFPGPHEAMVWERFMPDKAGSVEWTFGMNGTSPEVWSPSITATLELPASNRSLWLPWSMAGCNPNITGCEGCDAYGSPLTALPEQCFGNSTGFSYGAICTGDCPGIVSAPLASLLDTANDRAITLSAAPASNLLSVSNMGMASAKGLNSTGQLNSTMRTLEVYFGEGYRVSQNTAPVTLRFHITSSRGCTRDILQRYSEQLHPEYFEPPNPNVHYMASGMGSYAATQGPLTQSVGFAANWDATFWWPYIMQIAPTIEAIDNFTTPWGSLLDPELGYNNRLSQVRVKASYALRDAYYQQWQEANITVLGYFNGWELGQDMNDYPPKHCPEDKTQLWRHAPCFIHTYLDKALCVDKEGKRMAGPHGGRLWWDGDTQLDPGMTAHKEFVLSMVRNHLRMEPHFMGLASDGIRACLNYAGDDGIAVARDVNGSLRLVQDGWTAWAGLMQEVGPLLHDEDKLFSANTINGARVHLLRHVDMVMTEQSGSSYGLSAGNAWLGLQKPVVMWTTSTDPVDCQGCGDLFFQRLLHLGLFPMPPMPSADHCLANGTAAIHEQFMTYGPLFKALRGRTWVLRPHAVELRPATATEVTEMAGAPGASCSNASMHLDNAARSLPLRLPIANLFRDRSGAELIVITSPGQVISQPITAVLRGFSDSSEEPSVTAIRPGEADFGPVTTARRVNGTVLVTVVPCRGAVVVRVT